MKHLYTLLLLTFAFSATAQIEVPALPSYTICDDNNDAVATFNLSSYDALLLGSLDPALYSVAYFQSYSDAQQNTDPVNATQYNNATPGVQTIFVRVWENANEANYGIVLLDIRVEAPPVINQPAPYTLCGDAAAVSGTATFDLTQKNDEILGLNPNSTVNYYLTEDYSELIVNPELFTNTSNPQTLYVEVVSSFTGCTSYTTLTLNVFAIPQPISLPPIIMTTDCNAHNLYANNGLYDPAYSLSFYRSQSDAQAGIRAIITGPTFISGESGFVWVRVANASRPGCFIVLQQELLRNIININTDGQTVTVVATGVGELTYMLDNNAPQTSNIFENVSYGSHTVEVSDICGVTTIAFTVTPEAPVAEETQTFTPGQTLADLEITGENIQWYATETGGEPLPLTTPLEDGVTYYASQSIDGTPSARRIGVTATFALGLTENTLPQLIVYPNPASTVLNIKSNFYIYGVEVYNTLGQQVLNIVINKPEETINISALNNGVYLAKVQAGTEQKTIRFIKQ